MLLSCHGYCRVLLCCHRLYLCHRLNLRCKKCTRARQVACFRFWTRATAWCVHRAFAVGLHLCVESNFILTDLDRASFLVSFGLLLPSSPPPCQSPLNLSSSSAPPLARSPLHDMRSAVLVGLGPRFVLRGWALNQCLVLLTCCQPSTDAVPFLALAVPESVVRI